MVVCDMCEKKMLKCKNTIEIKIELKQSGWFEKKNIILNFCPNCIGKVTKMLFKYIETYERKE